MPRAQAIELLAQGDITIDPSNLGACATVTFGAPQLAIAGEFSAVGYMAGAKVDEGPNPPGVVLDDAAIAVTNSKSWSGCLSGTIKPNGAIGTVVYTLEASGSNGGDVFLVRVCSVVDGAVDCIGA